MIQIQVTQSPDLNTVATFNFLQNEIYIGSSTGDLMIKDPLLKKNHLMMEVVDSEFIVHPQKDVDFFLLNGKRTTAIRKIKINDKIIIGKTEIKILAFEFTLSKSRKDILNDKLAQLIEKESPRLPVIEQLSKMMK